MASGITQRTFDAIVIIGGGGAAFGLAAFLSGNPAAGFLGSAVSLVAIAYSFGVMAEHIRNQAKDDR